VILLVIYWGYETGDKYTFSTIENKYVQDFGESQIRLYGVTLFHVYDSHPYRSLGISFDVVTLLIGGLLIYALRDEKK